MASIQDTKLIEQFAKARLTRDARFDGVFFTAVNTTSIYCRPICPANPPKEQNVEYHLTAISAAEAGCRPCLRCRPDSAPNSNAWQGTDTTVRRAIKLINDGALQNQSLSALADRLGVSTRHLRALFQEKLGTSPKKYALYQQCLFAKQLLHDSPLSISDVAFAAGFNSVRRFNEAMQERLALSPSDIRKQPLMNNDRHQSSIQLNLHYRQPYAWNHLLDFLRKRLISGLEWAGKNYYGRTITTASAKGWFEIQHSDDTPCLELRIELSDLRELYSTTQRLRELFDLDAPIEDIDQQLQTSLNGVIDYLPGLRVPGVWAGFEAGVRAILGQQVSVKQAHSLVTKLVHELGEPESLNRPNKDSPSACYYFPTPDAVAASDLAFFRMPQARKDTLRRLAEHVMVAEQADDYDQWLALKGIGPWTVNYVKLRAAKDPDVWLAGDAGVKNALKSIDSEIDIEAAQPWRSYLVMQLWNHLKPSIKE